MSEPIIIGKVLPVVGLRELVYAPVVTDTGDGTVYGDVKQVQGVQPCLQQAGFHLHMGRRAVESVPQQRVAPASQEGTNLVACPTGNGNVGKAHAGQGAGG